MQFIKRRPFPVRYNLRNISGSEIILQSNLVIIFGPGIICGALQLFLFDSYFPCNLILSQDHFSSTFLNFRIVLLFYLYSGHALTVTSV